MSLTAGSRLGPYEIVAFIGHGGMGEVYRAHDSRLHRDVAIKVLPAKFAADADRVRRFEQEARAVSALNHPNIVTLFDLGQAGPDYFMATEFIEGRTLRAHLQERGRWAANEAIEIVLQCAAALAGAHTAGIVHRDIKPENIMLRHDGYVKLLDFGLATFDIPPAPDAETGICRSTSRRRASSLEPSTTSRPSRRVGSAWTHGRTCSASASCCTKC